MLQEKAGKDLQYENQIRKQFAVDFFTHVIILFDRRYKINNLSSK